MNNLIKNWLFLTVCGAILSVQPFAAHSDPLDPYIQAAKKEGSAKIGVTLRNKEYGKPTGDLYMAAFQKRYPFLDVKFKRIGGTSDRERILAELAAGVANWDVATVSDTEADVLASAKLTRNLDWEKLGIPKFLVHPDNLGLSLRTQIFGIGYNRNLVPDEVAQTFTWETCTDPKWKGMTSVNHRPRHMEQLYQDDAWGREKTLDYARRWAANKPVIEGSRSTSANKLNAGAYAMICGVFRSHIEELKVFAGSKSVGIVFPEPVPMAVGDMIFVPEKAKNPNAAVLFMAWTGSREAQNLLDQVNFSGHPAFEGNDINKVLRGRKLAATSWEHTAQADAILTDIIHAMGFPVVQKKKKK
ncbi:MAG: extracellular solute-binding protein [Desulfobacterales bacterium]|nr:extracellular solute-binding protein [Desulfobacterales bacterium]